MSTITPKRIGDYEVIRELGHGGMGEVYLVRNVLSDRIEAMKVLLPSLAGRSDFVARFMREIKVLASLDHPNIAALRTAFTADDQFVMIMEYVEGITLAQRLEKGAFSSSDALNYVDQALAALSYAHGKHVIHRDIKPGNMMLTPQGVVKLMDFGLARSADEVGLTMTGTTLGSLDYASPEQVQSQPTDERSDLYSVGVSLYQMVTGQRMFSVTSSFSIMEAQIKQTPRPPIEIVPTVPQALNDVIMMAVSKDPAQRFQSADAFRNALSQIAGSSAQASNQPTAATGAFVGRDSTPAVNPAFDPGFTVPANPASQTNRNLLLVLAAVLLAALLAGAAIYKSRQRGPQDVAAATSVQPPSAPGNASLAADHGNTQTQDTPPPQVTSPAVTDAQPPEDKTAAQKAPAVVARKARAEGGNANSAPGVSAEDIQAQQQAASGTEEAIRRHGNGSRSARQSGRIGGKQHRHPRTAATPARVGFARRRGRQPEQYADRSSQGQAGDGGFRYRTCKALHGYGSSGGGTSRGVSRTSLEKLSSKNKRRGSFRADLYLY